MKATGFPHSSVGKDCLQCRRPGFNPWVGKIPWRRERLPTLVFWPGEIHGCRVHGDAKSRAQLRDFHFLLLLPKVKKKKKKINEAKKVKL